ncbi:rod shape-determining protein MreD [uncultured Mesonia sp.]|uniref:rod shape-determining protein MreD n=1 Tax=uncultured Mesonia sp. TaxID=399731 RepID=UPI00374EC024
MNTILKHSIRFILLVLLQIFIFNKINLFEFVNPQVYIIFIILLPFNLSHAWVMLLSFLLGLSLDFFDDTGGMHAAACVFAAYIRPFLLRFAFGISYELNTLKLNQTPVTQRLSYIGLVILTHHFVLYLLEYFNLERMLDVLEKTIYSSVLTFLFIILITLIFKSKKT